jgi:hypothetical protein
VLVVVAPRGTCSSMGAPLRRLDGPDLRRPCDGFEAACSGRREAMPVDRVHHREAKIRGSNKQTIEGCCTDFRWRSLCPGNVTVACSSGSGS